MNALATEKREVKEMNQKWKQKSIFVLNEKKRTENVS